MLIWVGFDSFNITCLIQEAGFKKIYFPIEVVMNSF